MAGCRSTSGRLVAALGIALLLAGCAHVRPADPMAPGVDLDSINAKLAGRVVRVRLVDDTELLAHSVRVSADSVFLQPQRVLDVDWWLGPARALPTSEVGSLEVTRRSWGAADGALIGTGVGIVAGAAMGAATNEANEAPIWSNETSALVGSAVVGVVGAILGAVVGAGLGSVEVFDLTKAP